MSSPPHDSDEEPSHSLARPDWEFLPTARTTVYSDNDTLRLRLNTLDRKLQKLEKRHFYQRKDAADAYLAALDETEELLRRSREVFTHREAGDLVPNVLVGTTRTFRKEWRKTVEKEAYCKPLKGVPLDPHLDPPSSDDENMEHFEYRARKLNLRLKHAHAKRNRLDMRHTIEPRKLSAEEEAELIKQALIAAEEDPDDGIKNAPRANGGIGIVAGKFPRTDAYAMFSSLSLENTRLITVPQNPTHVTVATATHLHHEAPMSSDDFRIPNPLLGPRRLVRRHSLSYYDRTSRSGGRSRPGGVGVPRPDRLTMFVKSRLTGVRHLAFLPPLGGEMLTASTSHEERQRLMLRQLRNAAARVIQRMWHHRTGILMLLQKIKRRKKLEAEKAAALAAAIEADKLDAWNMFMRPDWAPESLKTAKNDIDIDNDIDDDISEIDGEDPRRLPPVQQQLRSALTQQSFIEPYKNSLSVVKKYKHIAHTITLNPRHAMSRREWRTLCQDVVQIVAGHGIGTKPTKSERRARRKLARKGHIGPSAFTKKRAARWLSQLYGRYVLTPSFMSIRYNERASEYWGIVDAKQFAEDTHFTPSDAIVRTLLCMCSKSPPRSPETDENGNVATQEEGLGDVPSAAPPSQSEANDITGVMPFADFARGVIRLCCLNTVDLVSFQVMVVNEGLNKVAADAEEAASENHSDVEEDAEPSPLELGVTQRRLNRLLCRLHQGHDEYTVLLPEDHRPGPSGYSWAIDQEDMRGIVERSLSEMRALRKEGELLDPMDLIELLMRCPILAWPCIHLQRCLRRRVLGERFWRDFPMDRVRPGVPDRLAKLTVRIARLNYHNMPLRHAWAATTRLIQFASLGLQSEANLGVGDSGTQSTCVVPQCGQRLDASDLSSGMCKACSLKSVGIIAESVGFRVAHRFRERSRWFDSLIYKDPPPVPVHTTWLLMRDPLTRSNFYFNGETAVTRWRLGSAERRLASEEHPIKVVDMRPKRYKKAAEKKAKKGDKKSRRKRRRAK
eukprot:g2461.t1